MPDQPKIPSPRELEKQRNFIMRELLREANHARNPLTERRLRARATQLLYRGHTACYSPDPSIRAQVVQLIEAGIDDLVDVITPRMEGATP